MPTSGVRSDGDPRLPPPPPSPLRGECADPSLSTPLMPTPHSDSLCFLVTVRQGLLSPLEALPLASVGNPTAVSQAAIRGPNCSPALLPIGCFGPSQLLESHARSPQGVTRRGKWMHALKSTSQPTKGSWACWHRAPDHTPSKNQYCRYRHHRSWTMTM